MEPAASETVPEPNELNLAVVRGRCSSPAEVRTLPSGSVLAQLQVTTRVDGRALSVPVAVTDPPAWVTDLDEGDVVIVLGAVRRRFFRAGGATASRVEIQAATVARPRDRRKLAAARRRVDALLDALGD
jgi:single-strand DNA-binding protein